MPHPMQKCDQARFKRYSVIGENFFYALIFLLTDLSDFSRLLPSREGVVEVRMR
jgi:hypothetical protein